MLHQSTRLRACAAALVLLLSSCAEDAEVQGGSQEETPPAEEQREPPRDAQELVALPVVPREDAADGALTVEAICHPSKPRTGLLVLSWVAERDQVARQRLDVTTFKNGFEQSVFTSVWPVLEDKGSRWLAAREVPDRADLRALELPVASAELDEGEGRCVLRLETRAPGITYFLRLSALDEERWSAYPIVSATAPICPADMKE